MEGPATVETIVECAALVGVIPVDSARPVVKARVGSGVTATAVSIHCSSDSTCSLETACDCFFFFFFFFFFFLVLLLFFVLATVHIQLLAIPSCSEAFSPYLLALLDAVDAKSPRARLFPGFRPFSFSTASISTAAPAYSLFFTFSNCIGVK